MVDDVIFIENFKNCKHNNLGWGIKLDLQKVFQNIITCMNGMSCPKMSQISTKRIQDVTGSFSITLKKNKLMRIIFVLQNQFAIKGSSWFWGGLKELDREIKEKTQSRE